MRPRLFLLFIFFLLYSATSYIGSTSSIRLKEKPFNWKEKNIHTVGTILTFTQFFSIFLGGILAAFIIPVHVLLSISLIILLVALSLFEAIYKFGMNNLNKSEEFLSQNYACSIIVFFVFFGIYSGLSKFILLVMMLDQDESSTIEFTMMSYLFSLNLSIIFVYSFFPSIFEPIEFYLTFSLPLIIVAIGLLLIGRWKKIYQLDSTQLNIAKIMDSVFRKKKQDKNSIFASIKKHNIVEPIHHLTTSWTSTPSSNIEDGSEEALLSFSKLCIIFITLLPYGICESQLRTTYLLQSNYLSQPGTSYYAFKGGFWVQIINCCGVIIFIPFLLVLREISKKFDRIYSKTMGKIFTGNVLIFLSILSAAVVETIRLKVYWGKGPSIEPSTNTKFQIIDNSTYSAADMSVFYMAPQLLFSSISEIFMITTCGSFMYQQSVGSMRYMAIAFFLGAVGSGGAGDLISLLITILLSSNLFDASDLNKRTFVNGTCCSFQSRIDYWFYGLAALFLFSMVFTSMLLMKFKHYFQWEKRAKNMINIENSFSD